MRLPTANPSSFQEVHPLLPRTHFWHLPCENPVQKEGQPSSSRYQEVEAAFAAFQVSTSPRLEFQPWLRGPCQQYSPFFPPMLLEKKEGLDPISLIQNGTMSCDRSWTSTLVHYVNKLCKLFGVYAGVIWRPGNSTALYVSCHTPFHNSWHRSHLSFWSTQAIWSNEPSTWSSPLIRQTWRMLIGLAWAHMILAHWFYLSAQLEHGPFIGWVRLHLRLKSGKAKG